MSMDMRMSISIRIRSPGVFDIVRSINVSS